MLGTTIFNVGSDGDDGDDRDDGRGGVPEADEAAFGIPARPVSIDFGKYAGGIEALKKTPFTYFSQTKEFHHFCNGPLEDIGRSIANIDAAQSNAYLSSEQTNKGMVAAATIKIAHLMTRPSVMLVADLKANIAHLCQTKIDIALQQFGINAINPSGRAGFSKLSNNADQMVAFREGRLTLVVQAIDNNLMLLNDLIRTHNIGDIVVVLDESDAMWSSPVSKHKPWTASDLTSREKHLYNFLAGKDAGGVGLPLFGNNRIRCLFQVSASHVATLEWHSMWRCPYRAHVVELDLLKSRHYAVYDCLSTLKSPRGFDMYLVKETQNSKMNKLNKVNNSYNMESDEVNRMIDVFSDDAHDPLKTGLLMMVGMSPLIQAKTGMNAFQISESILNKMCDRAEATPGPSTRATSCVSSIGIIVCEKGPILVVIDEVSRKVAFTQITRTIKNAQGRDVSVRVTTAEDAIKHVNRTYGLATPLFIVGYQLLRRCLSLRSDDRVITHLMVGPSAGMSAANVQQMSMRCGGWTVGVRESNGFEDVTVLMTRDDYELVQNLYKFTCYALNVSATGRLEDVDAWKTQEYGAHFMNVLQTSRPHATGRMGKEIGVSLSRWAAPKATNPAKPASPAAAMEAALGAAAAAAAEAEAAEAEAADQTDVVSGERVSPARAVRKSSAMAADGIHQERGVVAVTHDSNRKNKALLHKQVAFFAQGAASEVKYAPATGITLPPTRSRAVQYVAVKDAKGWYTAYVLVRMPVVNDSRVDDFVAVKWDFAVDSSGALKFKYDDFMSGEPAGSAAGIDKQREEVPRATMRAFYDMYIKAGHRIESVSIAQLEELGVPVNANQRFTLSTALTRQRKYLEHPVGAGKGVYRLTTNGVKAAVAMFET